MAEEEKGEKAERRRRRSEHTVQRDLRDKENEDVTAATDALVTGQGE